MSQLVTRRPEELDPMRARYVRLLLHAATAGEPPAGSPMDAALALCHALSERPRPTGTETTVASSVDVGAHARPLYRGLLAYAAVLAHRVGEAGAAGAPGYLFDLIDHADDAVDDAIAVTAHDPDRGDEMAATDGAAWCVAAWAWLARFAAAPLTGERDPPSPAALLPFQRTDGSFLGVSSTDNPEPHWYHELILLHAVTSYALFTGDAASLAAARRAALYHHHETQPDHATNQPWAVHAFLLHPETVPTADLILLAAGVNRPGGLDAVSRVLLADAAVCLSIAR